MSSRPRPRPRTKPRAISSTDDVVPTDTASSSSSSQSQNILVADSDEMFMRNRGRTAVTWGKLEKLTKDTTPVPTDNDTDDTSPTPRRKKLKRSPWRGHKELERLSSVEPCGSGSEDDIEIIGVAKALRGKAQAQGKQERERSRSITPPPELPLHRLQHARAVVQQALNPPQRSISPQNEEYENEHSPDLDTILQNPELAKLAKAVVARAGSETRLARSPAQESTDVVLIHVKWQPHPRDPNGKNESWDYKINRDVNFRDLFEATCEDACIPSENLIMAFGGKRIFASVTPVALQIWREAEMMACDKVTYEYLRAHPASTSSSHSFEYGTPVSGTSSDGEDARTPPHEQAVDEDEIADVQTDDDENAFKLILRSAISEGKDITLTVRPTTKCGTIVKAYLEKLGVTKHYPGAGEAEAPNARKPRKALKDPRLSVDGDKLKNDSEIGDADLEDGDLVEVVGL